MNILSKILFSYRGKIGRADYIYGLVYSFLILFTSLDVFLTPTSIYLIGGGIDTWLLCGYILSALGLILFAWIFFAIVIKRLRTFEKSPYLAPFALFPPLLFLGLIPDKEKFEYNNNNSVADQVFFYAFIAIIIIALFSLYRLTIYMRFIFLICAMVGAFMVYLFVHDVKKNSTLAVKYVGWDLALDLSFVLIIVIFVRIFILSPFQIIGPSMESTFHGGVDDKKGGYSDGEYILVDKISYRVGLPFRGDVVVFTPGIGPTKRYLIKRIIGLPGDTVKIENGFVFVATADRPDDFIKIDESDYLQDKFGNTCLANLGGKCLNENQKFVIPADRYFLMGDYRPLSLDARKCFSNSGCIGEFSSAQFVPFSQIQGRVAYSLGHFDILNIHHKTINNFSLYYPTLGKFQWIIPFRGLNIKNTHTYSELR